MATLFLLSVKLVCKVSSDMTYRALETHPVQASSTPRRADKVYTTHTCVQRIQRIHTSCTQQWSLYSTG